MLEQHYKCPKIEYFKIEYYKIEYLIEVGIEYFQFIFHQSKVDADWAHENTYGRRQNGVRGVRQELRLQLLSEDAHALAPRHR